MKKKAFENFTDEQFLREFMNRFECDGAILVYYDSGTEYGFGSWRNMIGKCWTKDILRRAKESPIELSLEDKPGYNDVLAF